MSYKLQPGSSEEEAKNVKNGPISICCPPEMIDMHYRTVIALESISEEAKRQSKAMEDMALETKKAMYSFNKLLHISSKMASRMRSELTCLKTKLAEGLISVSESSSLSSSTGYSDAFSSSSEDAEDEIDGEVRGRDIGGGGALKQSGRLILDRVAHPDRDRRFEVENWQYSGPSVSSKAGTLSSYRNRRG